MTIKETDQARLPVSADVYSQLAAATPVDKARIIFELIANHPEGVLDLSQRDSRRAILNDIDLSPPALEKFNLSFSEKIAFDPDTGGLSLRRARLGGARLRQANLQQVVLEGADLQGADLVGANLRGTALSEADLRGALIEFACLESAVLRFANISKAILEGSDLRRTDLWGANLEKAEITEANLQEAVLTEAKLSGADLTHSDLKNARLGRADFESAILKGADLQGASLEGANLRGAVLKNAKLHGLVLSGSDIRHVFISGAWLDKCQLEQEQFGGAIGEEIAGEYEDARKGYLALERNFIELGDPDAASWAYRKRRRMQKLAARKRARLALKSRKWGRSVANYMRYLSDQLVEWLCDYGESINRVLASLLVVYLAFTLIYGLTGSVVRVQETPDGAIKSPTSNLLDLLIFSLLAMTTSGSPAVGLMPSSEMVHALTGIQALLGIALTGLLGFVLGNLIRR